VACQVADWSPAAVDSHRWSAASTLTARPDIGVGLSRERLPGLVHVRQRAGGETFVPAGGAHRRDLRKWLQEHDVLPWRRAELPLLFADDRLIAVADLGVADDFAARSGEPSWRIEWQGRGRVTVADVVASLWPLRLAIR
jgi:tRNA(Ile)-lysidine synthase